MREMYCPDVIEKIDWAATIGLVKAAETMGDQPRAFW